MLKEAIGTGTTLEEAKTEAVAQLNAPEDVHVSIEVLEIPVKKTLGLFGGSLAKVRAFYEAPDEIEEEEEEEKNAVVGEEKEENRSSEDFAPVRNYVSAILKGLGILDAEITIRETGSALNIQLDCGDDSRVVIGRKGETLDAIQYVTRLFVGKNMQGFRRVLINADNYREKRESALRNTAQKKAALAKRFGKNISLDPMNPYERRIVHTEVQEIEGVTSYSVGSDGERRVIISPEGTQQNTKRPNPTGERLRRSRAGKTDQKVSRAPRSDVSSASLYEKIEPKND